MSTVQPSEQAALTGRPWSVRMAETMVARHTPDLAQWHYDYGLVLMAIEHVWRATSEVRYWDHVKHVMDQFVAPDGAIRTYRLEEYNIDQVNQGRLLFPLYRAAGDERYRRAAALLRRQ